MKTNTWPVCMLMAALGLSLISTSALAQGRFAPLDTMVHRVKLTVNNPGSSQAELVSTNTRDEFGCDRLRGRRGCIVMKRQYAADIIFRLGGRNESLYCTEGEEWTLSGVQMAGYNVSSKNNVDWGAGVPQEVVDDFGADPNTGELPFATLNRGLIRIHNDNRSEYEIWYRVRASCNGKDIYLDPRVKNTGGTVF